MEDSVLKLLLEVDADPSKAEAAIATLRGAMLGQLKAFMLGLHVDSLVRESAKAGIVNPPLVTTEFCKGREWIN